MKKSSVWTFERRVAMGVIGRLAVEGVLTDDVFVNGSCNYIQFLADMIGDGLRDDLESLGVGTSLQEINRSADVGRLYLPEHQQRRAQ